MFAYLLFSRSFWPLIALPLVLLAAPALAQSAGSITGTVRDAATLEALPGVNVVVQGTTLGAATNAEGRYVITAVPVGTVALEVRSIGFAPLVRTDIVVKPGRPATADVLLNEARIEGAEVTVTAGYFQPPAAAPTSTVAFSTEEIRRSPGAGQEIARVLNALPGVASRGETSQDLFVRGGSPAENGFYIDQILIPNAQHFSTPDGSSFGPTGLINTEFIDDITFSSGGFSASYGDRLSSISEIRYRTGGDRLTGEVGANFTGGTFIVEGPIPGGSAFISGRRSYLDLVADAIDAGGAPRFSDLQGKVTLDLSPSQRLSVLNLYGSSEFAQEAEDAVDAGEAAFGVFENQQNTVGLSLRSLWGARGYSTTALSYSFIERRNTVTSVRDGFGDIREDFRNGYLTLRNVNTLQLGPQLEVEAGVEGTIERGTFDFDQAAYVSAAGAQQGAVGFDLDLTSARLGTFATFVWQPTARLTVSPGLRVDYGSLNEDVYPQPRLGLAYDLTEKVRLRAAGGVYRQAVPLYVRAQSAANETLPHVRADHLIGGVDVLLAPDLKLTVEGFSKTYRDVPQFADGNPLGTPVYVLDERGDYAGALTSDGRARARGIELLVQKKLSRAFYGLVSASYFRSQYEDQNGVWRNRDFDTQTQFSVIGGWKPNAKWELSARWSYLGGRPTTPIDVGQSIALDAEVRDVTRTNEERLPAYHSLYLRVDRRFNFRATNLTTFVSLWNAYSRTNIEDTFWNFTEQRVDEAEQFSLLPVVGIEFEF
ncbi:MAG: TonB-dependent receptor [Bacteroidota bacterium]